MSNYNANIIQRVYNLKYGFTFSVHSCFFHFKDFYEMLKQCANIYNKSHEYPNKRFKQIKKIMCKCEDKTKCDCLNYCFFEKELINRLGDVTEIRKVCEREYHNKRHSNG